MTRRDDACAAQWISSPDGGSDDRRTLYFRRIVDLPAPVVRARASVSALGWYRLFINQSDVTGDALVPRWTPFDHEVEYQVYDVTEEFSRGENVIGIAVGDGRYRGALGFDLKDARYGERLGVLAEIVLECADGTTHTITTDDRWHVGRGRIRSADPAFGERVDLRIDAEQWLRADIPLEEQTSVDVLPAHERVLVAETVQRFRAVGELPATVHRAASGAQILDFGQNFTGVAAVTLRGSPGATVRILYGEVLTPEGDLDTDYLFPKGRGPDEWFQRDEIVLGPDPVRYCPWFTFRGFRYASVEGADPLTPEDASGIVMSSDLPQLAEFEASDPRLEKLWHNALWSLRSNFLDTATDCPTRERSGWTGDVQVFGSTAVQMVDSAKFLRQYLHNLAIEQYADGRIPPYIPSERSATLGPHHMEYVSGSVGWGDVAVMLPWTLYQYYGDEEVLRLQYDSATKWVDFLARLASERRGLARRFGRRVGELERFIVDAGFHWGEWLRPGEGNTWLRSKLMAPAAVATAYFAHSSRLLSQIAGVLGRSEDEARYGRLSTQVEHAWHAAFVRQGGARIGEDKQDDYVRALAFDLLREHERPAAIARLVELIEGAGDHLGTGFLSTPLLLPALADAGRADLAHRVLFQTTSPSWLAQVAQGATTIWEEWEGIDDDGRAHGSHNHYAFGSVVRYLHEYVAGLAPAAPGYREIRFAPTLPRQLTSAGLRLRTPYGDAASRWERSEAGTRLDIVVPPGATGTVHFDGRITRVESGEHSFTAKSA
ncbi:family 78 glycoside hydrolase catalytic domain [Brachybacterium massiliense]|uniref:family 78 glycoside hydrolase catalytic domain n=1 Tax=Brachybacterium massiliense TaxID=1755098 RepID=UPI000B3BB0AC|nr:family 78 glycoside hydrolase catalytic domain [Brachybacterium massiliense]